MGKARGTKVAASGKVIAAKQNEQLLVRFTPDALERFRACVTLDAHIHGGDVNLTAVVRKLCHAFCERVETIAASPEAKEAAKVLRKKAS
jgi:hypothetical protein